MNAHQAIELVESSDKFEEFKEEHPDAYLVHCFCTIEKKERSPWQVGYYEKKTSKITSFTAGEEVTRLEDDEAFRKEGHVPSLDDGSVKTSLDDALAVAEHEREERCSAEHATKTIIILQTIDDRQVWNITIVTHAFTLLNARVDAGNGETVSVTVDSVLNLGQRT